MTETIHCIKCKREILDLESDPNKGIAYCRGCDYYFPNSTKVNRVRDEIYIPNGVSHLRIRFHESSMHTKVRWFKNYNFKELMGSIPTDDTELLITFGKALCYFVNSTYITVNNDFLKIETKPVDLLPMSFYAKKLIHQLYVQALEPGTDKYGLFVKLTYGDEVKLLWNLDKKVLLFLEQEIERVLGIEDSEVLGEVVN